MTMFVSFYELRVRNGELHTFLGSGTADDIIDRQLADPNFFALDGQVSCFACGAAQHKLALAQDENRPWMNPYEKY